MAKVLITGATGFIGSALAEKLIARGDTVRALIRSGSSTENLYGLNIEITTGDYSDFESLKNAVKGVDYIYHVAGVTKALNKETYFKGNVTATENLLKAILQSNPTLKRFIHVSSGAAAGSSPSLDRPIDETVTCKPVTEYGRTKLLAEEICKNYFDELPITIIRPSIIYGERDKDLLEHFKTVQSGIIPVFGFKEKRYDYLYVGDLVDAMIACAEHTRTFSKIYFISGSHHSWQEVGEVAKRVLGKKGAIKIIIPDTVSYLIAAVVETVNRFQNKISILNRDRVRDGMERYWTFSTTSAKRDFDFKQTTTLEDGFKRTVKWYREKGWLNP